MIKYLNNIIVLILQKLKSMVRMQVMNSRSLLYLLLLVEKLQADRQGLLFYGADAAR